MDHPFGKSCSKTLSSIFRNFSRLFLTQAPNPQVIWSMDHAFRRACETLARRLYGHILLCGIVDNDTDQPYNNEHR